MGTANRLLAHLCTIFSSTNIISCYSSSKIWLLSNTQQNLVPACASWPWHIPAVQSEVWLTVCACAAHTCLLTGVSEVPDVRFVGNGRTVTEAEGTISVCVVSGQLAEEIIPVNVTISTESGRAKGKSNKSHWGGGNFSTYQSLQPNLCLSM